VPTNWSKAAPPLARSSYCRDGVIPMWSGREWIYWIGRCAPSGTASLHRGAEEEQAVTRRKSTPDTHWTLGKGTPDHYLIACFDDAPTAEAALSALRENGFADNEMLALHGYGAYEQARRLEETNIFQQLRSSCTHSRSSDVGALCGRTCVSAHTG
jgi:hypothetical protein